MAMNGQQSDAVIVGSIGTGVLNKLNQKGMRAFQAQKATISFPFKCYRIED